MKKEKMGVRRGEMSTRKTWLMGSLMALVLALGAIGLAAMGNSALAAEEGSEEAAVEPHVVVPSSNPMSGDPDAELAGRDLYFKWCVACHGAHADGVSRFGRYAYDLRKYWRGYSEFVGIVLFGRVKKRMPAWEGILDGDEISQIGAFLESLSIEGARWEDY